MYHIIFYLNKMDWITLDSTEIPLLNESIQ